MYNEGRLRDYFDAEGKDYDRYFTGNPDSVMRRLCYRWCGSNIHGRLNAVLKLSGPDVSGRRILELGSGSGRYAVELAKRGARVVGVDFSPAMVRLATELAHREGVRDHCEFREENIFAYHGGEPFDVVFAAGVFDYLPPAKARELLGRMARLSGDRVILTFPLRMNLNAMVRWFWLTAKRVGVYFYSMRSMHDMLAEVGLHPDGVVQLRGVAVLGARRRGAGR
jgi:SAM-dependent methyltransferase